MRPGSSTVLAWSRTFPGLKIEIHSPANKGPSAGGRAWGTQIFDFGYNITKTRSQGNARE